MCFVQEAIQQPIHLHATHFPKRYEFTIPDDIFFYRQECAYGAS